MIVAAGIASGAFTAGYVVHLDFGPACLEARSTGTLAAASVISVGSWVMIMSGALCGRIVDRTGRRDLVLATCMAGAILGLWLLTVPGAGLAARLRNGGVLHGLLCRDGPPGRRLDA